MHARELRETHAKAGRCDLIADCTDRTPVRLRGTLKTVTLRPRGGVPALEAELFDGSGSLIAGLAGPARDRGHLARPVRWRCEGRIGRHGRRPGDLQPPLHRCCPDRPTRRRSAAPHPTYGHPMTRQPTDDRHRRGAGPPTARPGARRPARHGRGGRPDPDVHRGLAGHPAPRARRSAPASAVAAASSWWPGWCSARRCSSCVNAWSGSGSAGSSSTSPPAAAAAPTTRRWPTSCPG